MSKLDDITLGDLGRAVVRYRPFIAVVVAILLVTAFLPGEGSDSADLDAAAGVQAGVGGEDSGTTGAVAGGSEGADGGEGATSGTIAAGGAAGSTAGGSGTRTSSGGVPSGGGGAATGGGDPTQLVANCDPSTGRIKVPSRSAPVCVQRFGGDNGGATYQGVTADEITVAVYLAEDNPAADAILAAAGADDSPEEVRATYQEWADYYEHHYQMWGRKVKLVFVDGSGAATDDAAGKADAIKVATEVKAFASWGAPNNTYVDELVARGVMCFCTVSLPIEFYLERAPYVWSTLMASTQGYVHRAEYVGKRLKGGKAVHAGDPLFQAQDRVFGLLYYETTDFAYKAGADFFVKHLKEQYGVTLKVVAAYNGFPDLAANQEQARPLIQKLKDAGVTTVIFAGDPFGPIFFTQEATRQAYRPEWVVTGSALTDTSFFARTYDQEQWSHAFGISFLTARMPERFSDSYRVFTWHHGRDPSADGTYGVIRAPIDIFYNAVHLSGGPLTPQSVQAALFSMPVTGQGSITGVTQSYGQHGFWPWDDYLSFDDVTEIWWDRTARGEDEIGNEGIGLYRYVDGGVRYLPTQHPPTPPKAFVLEGTVTIYDEPPSADRWPEYPHEK